LPIAFENVGEAFENDRMNANLGTQDVGLYLGDPNGDYLEFYGSLETSPGNVILSEFVPGLVVVSIPVSFPEKEQPQTLIGAESISFGGPLTVYFDTKEALEAVIPVQYNILQRFAYSDYSLMIIPADARGATLLDVIDETPIQTLSPIGDIPITTPLPQNNQIAQVRLRIPTDFPKESTQLRLALYHKPTQTILENLFFAVITERRFIDEVPIGPLEIEEFSVGHLAKYVSKQPLSIKFTVHNATSRRIVHGVKGSSITETTILQKTAGRVLIPTLLPTTPGTAPFDYRLTLIASNDNDETVQESLELTIHRDVVSPMNFFRFTMIGVDEDTGNYIYSNVTPRRVITQVNSALKFFEDLQHFLTVSEGQQIDIATYNDPVDLKYAEGQVKLEAVADGYEQPLNVIAESLEQIYNQLLASGIGGITIQGINATADGSGSSSNSSGE
jgi:hypothetical protein